MALILSEKGYGTVRGILDERTDVAMDMWHYFNFRQQYDETQMAMNKEAKK